MVHAKHRFLAIAVLLAIVLALTGSALADGPTPGREGRAEIRFLEGMIDHHQMGLDMAHHCLDHATDAEVLATCEAVIAAQQPEIEQMQGWLRDWYGIAYQPMSMLGVVTSFNAPATSGVIVVAQPDASALVPGTPSGMCSMMGGEGCAMMGSGDLTVTMDMMPGMMQSGGMGGMMGSDMSTSSMQMQIMMMQLQLMQMQLMQMSGLSVMSMMGGGATSCMCNMGMMGENGMSGMGMGMMGQGGMSGMQGMSQTAPSDPAETNHSAHHPDAAATPSHEMLGSIIEQLNPAAEATAEAMDHSQHQMAPGAEASPEAMDHTQHEGAAAGGLHSDPAMTMGMMAGFDRLTGMEYDLAWLEAMIEHHQGAIDMAERILQWAQHDEIRALAEAIISAQSAEIEAMEALIARLSA